MKNVLIASAIALVTSTAAFAAPIEAEHFTVGGEIAVGGYYDNNAGYDHDFYNDGVTGADLSIAFDNGTVVGYTEVDFNLADNFTAKDTSNDLDLDKAWIGVKTGNFGVLSYGLENDTALDAIDGAGDMTVEFGYSAADADDAFNVIKYEGNYKVLAYGASVSDTGSDGRDNSGSRDGTFNTYVGLANETSAIYAGYEIRESGHTVYTLVGKTKVGIVDLGATAFVQETEANCYDAQDGYFVSAGVPISKLYVSTGYAYTTDNESVANLGASLAVTKHVDVMVDTKYNFETEDAAAFAKAAYTF